MALRLAQGTEFTEVQHERCEQRRFDRQLLKKLTLNSWFIRSYSLALTKGKMSEVKRLNPCSGARAAFLRWFGIFVLSLSKGEKFAR